MARRNPGEGFEPSSCAAAVTARRFSGRRPERRRPRRSPAALPARRWSDRCHGSGRKRPWQGCRWRRSPRFQIGLQRGAGIARRNVNFIRQRRLGGFPASACSRPPPIIKMFIRAHEMACAGAHAAKGINGGGRMSVKIMAMPCSGGGDHFVVADRAARLDHAGNADRRRGIDAVANGKKASEAADPFTSSQPALMPAILAE